MKKLLALSSLFIIGSLALGACGDPCKKAVDKFEKCSLQHLEGKNREKFKRASGELRRELMKVCKAHQGTKSRFKECLKIDDCKKFARCMAEE